MERRKSEIMEAAKKAAAEIDRDIAAMEALAAKYNLDIVERQEAQHPSRRPSIVTTNISITKASQEEAEDIIRAKGRPVPLGEIFEALSKRGIVFKSKTPRSTLSAVLGQSGKLVSIKNVGWWLKDAPLPDNEKAADSESVGDQPAASDEAGLQGREAGPGGGT
jgi:hypothetical protein